MSISIRSVILLMATTGLQADDAFHIRQESARLLIAFADRPVAEFVFRDDQILRPYFANVYSPAGIRVTRPHPPIDGVDAADHATMHPGIWLAFGDINGEDFWRNKARIEHVRFLQVPQVDAHGVSFDQECRLVSSTGIAMGTMVNRCRIAEDPSGWLLTWQATFSATQTDLIFGDQEEMGFGARVATAITEKNSGLLTNSEDLRTAAGTWGQSANWCDYSGVQQERRIGMTLMSGPQNFRQPWWHNRDYGLAVANPFGRAAMRQGDQSEVTIQQGQSLTLVFGSLVHDSDSHDSSAAYQRFVQRVKNQPPSSF